MTASEMHNYLLGETAAETTYMIYSHEALNRFFVEDYMLFFKNSFFSDYRFEPIGIYEVNLKVQAALEARHPGHKIFGCGGLKVAATK